MVDRSLALLATAIACLIVALVLRAPVARLELHVREIQRGACPSSSSPLCPTPPTLTVPR